MRLFSILVSILVLSTASGLAYTLTFPTGFSAVANQLDNGSGNTADQLFPNPTGALDNCLLEKWTCTGYTIYTFDSAYPSGFADATDTHGVPAPTLAPGEGAVFNNQSGAAVTITFTGTPIAPVLPAPLPCGCGQLNLLSRQTPGIGTYETFAGLAPQEEAQVFKFIITPSGNIAGFLTNTFHNCLWSPAVPTANVGESVFVIVPCTTNIPCPCQPAPFLLFNTGADANGGVLTNGAVDPHYTLTTNPNGNGSNAVVITGNGLTNTSLRNGSGRLSTGIARQGRMFTG